MTQCRKHLNEKMKTSKGQMVVYGTRIEDDRPEFYKIIQGESAKKVLRIPPQFMKVLAGDISDSATLVLSSGGRWEVAVRKQLSGTYFEDGWEEFMRENELGDTELLFFRYDGNMNFHVKVFGKNGIKRSTPISEEETRASNAEKDGILAPISFEEETRASSAKNKGIKRSAPISSEEETRASSAKRSRGRPRKCPVELTGPGETSVPQNFTSKFPHFECYMTKSCVQGCRLLTLPRSFSKAHLPEEKTKVVLRNSEGKTWEVKCIYHDRGHSLSGGWGKFVRDNSLKLGDTCIFELVEEDVLQVHVFASEP